MRIKVNEGFRIAGPDGNFGEGTELEVADIMGRTFVSAGVATEVKAEEVAPIEPDGSADIETADALGAPEKATRKRAPKKTARKGK